MGKYTEEDLARLRRMYAPDATADEFELFVSSIERTGLDPDMRQIYVVARRNYDKDLERYVSKHNIQVSIDGFRLIAERTGHYAGQLGPFWCGPDGEWRDVWLAKDPPAAAKVGVMRDDFQEPLWAVALYKSYVQTSNNKPQRLWASMPELMIGKCAEALALRRAFPQELSGLYTTEEMMQADNGSIGKAEVHEPGEEEPPPPPKRSSNRQPTRKPPPSSVSDVPPVDVPDYNEDVDFGQDATKVAEEKGGSAGRNGNGVTKVAKRGTMTEATRGKLFAVGGDAYGEEWDSKRAVLVKSVTKGASESAADLLEEEAGRLIEGMQNVINQRKKAERAAARAKRAAERAAKKAA